MAHLPLEGLRFALSKRDTTDDLDYVLADIPFLAVGILAFCIFTFLAFLKRLGIMHTILHMSIIAAFVASLLDLSQILQRGKTSTDLSSGTNSVQPLIKGREIGYAFSVALRFLFFWVFVAVPPKAERDTPNALEGNHSGNWSVWGLVGLSLRWLTLGLILATFALQVVWRLNSSSNSFTNPYSAESAIEVILSIMLGLKIFLNCVHCTIVSKWVCALDYLGFIVSLMFSIGFGVANITRFKFTETILGRFLQGLNFYLLVLSSLLDVFLPSWRCRSNHAPPFRPLSPRPLASSFNVSQPTISTPRFSVIRPRLPSSVLQQPPVDLPSSTAKMTGWLANQRKRLSNLSLSRRGDSQTDMNSLLWKQTGAERTATYWENASKDSDVFGKVYGNHDSYLGVGPSPPPIEKLKLEAPRLGTGLIKPTSPLYSNVDPSLTQHLERRISRQVDSPVFGLNGIIRPSTVESARRSQGSATVTGPDRTSDISHLFRKQEELDNSIAALKLLGGPAGQPSSPSVSSKQSAALSTTRSEFSLSNFPNPPWASISDSVDLNEPHRSLTPIRETRPLRLSRPSVDVDNVQFELIPPRMPISIIEHYRTDSLPISEMEDEEVLVSARTQRFDSQGTQYDVTSFIGNLTSVPSVETTLPGHKKDFSGSSNDTGDLTVTSSGTNDPEPATTIVTLQQSKQTYVGSPLAKIPVVGSTNVGILPATRIMLPPRPKLDISQPHPSDLRSRLREEANSEAFERPRAVPPVHR